jgi:hypothetical protein
MLATIGAGVAGSDDEIDQPSRRVDRLLVAGPAVAASRWLHARRHQNHSVFTTNVDAGSDPRRGISDHNISWPSEVKMNAAGRRLSRQCHGLEGAHGGVKSDAVGLQQRWILVLDQGDKIGNAVDAVTCVAVEVEDPDAVVLAGGNADVGFFPSGKVATDLVGVGRRPPLATVAVCCRFVGLLSAPRRREHSPSLDGVGNCCCQAARLAFPFGDMGAGENESVVDLGEIKHAPPVASKGGDELMRLASAVF